MSKQGPWNPKAHNDSSHEEPEACTLLDVELYFLGEHPKHKEALIQEHISSCPEHQEYYEQLKKQNQLFLDKHPYQHFKNRNINFSPKPILFGFNPTWFKPSWAIVLLFLCLPLIYVQFSVRHTPSSTVDTIRYKSPFQLSFLLKRNGTITQGNSNHTISIHDGIQIQWTSSQAGYLTLISVDDNGVISFYHPNEYSDTCSIYINPGANQNYPVGIELDATPGKEWFLGILTPKPLKSTEVIKWLKPHLTLPLSKSNTEIMQHTLSQNVIQTSTVFSYLLLTKHSYE